MSILDKNPGPWRGFPQHAPPCDIVDADGVEIVHVGDVEHRYEDVERLVLAAPELLAALKAVTAGEPGARTSAEALIARIEGK